MGKRGVGKSKRASRSGAKSSSQLPGAFGSEDEVHVPDKSGGAVEIISVSGKDSKRCRDLKLTERMALLSSRAEYANVS